MDIPSLPTRRTSNQPYYLRPNPEDLAYVPEITRPKPYSRFEKEDTEYDEELEALPKPSAPTLPPTVEIAELIALLGMDSILFLNVLGCQDKDPVVCSKVTEESCRARPGFYLKLCPVKCKNCNGLVCIDSNKVDCDEVRRRDGCRLTIASEYCPKSCEKCHTPSYISGAHLL